MVDKRARTAAEHTLLVRSLQSELLADDLDPPHASHFWSEDDLRAWFEAGGTFPDPDEREKPELIIREAKFQVPGPRVSLGILRGLELLSDSLRRGYQLIDVRIGENGALPRRRPRDLSARAGLSSGARRRGAARGRSGGDVL